MRTKQRRQQWPYSDEPRGGEFKVLIFDTNQNDLIRHAEPFEAQGFDVCKCASAESALRCIEREDFDFAVVDQGSDTDGLHVLRRFVHYNLRTPFVIVAESQDPRRRDEHSRSARPITYKNRCPAWNCIRLFRNISASCRSNRSERYES